MEITKKKANKERKLIVLLYHVIMMLTGVSLVITGYDIVNQYWQESNNLPITYNGSNITIPRNNTALDFALDKVNFYSMISASGLQCLFVGVNGGLLCKKIVDLKNNAKLSISDLHQSKPSKSIKFVEENFGKYLIYKILSVENALDIGLSKQINILNKYIDYIRREVTNLKENKISGCHEINLFLFRFFENSKVATRTQKIKILESYLKILTDGYDEFTRSTPSKNETDSFIENYESRHC